MQQQPHLLFSLKNWSGESEFNLKNSKEMRSNMGVFYRDIFLRRIIWSLDIYALIFKCKYLVAWLDFFIIGSNDETCLVVQEKSKNSGL